MRGPIDYIIVGFEGNNFNGNILKALTKVIDAGIISVLTLALIQKNDKGEIDVLDLNQVGNDYILEFVRKYPVDKSLITYQDIKEVDDLIEKNTSVGLLVIEQLWAKPLKQAIIEANGVLVAEGRIHPEAADELNEGKG
ncbi:MAG TPA: DUF6325 family protein [Candidatus Saccharimonadales bacterium]|nr:DUF6325 family protein [Candidatus Saccharimonadales bacterium]